MKTKHLLVIAAICLAAYNRDDPWWFRIPVLAGAFLALLYVGDRIDVERERSRYHPGGVVRPPWEAS